MCRCSDKDVEYVKSVHGRCSDKDVVDVKYVEYVEKYVAAHTRMWSSRVVHLLIDCRHTAGDTPDPVEHTADTVEDTEYMRIRLKIRPIRLEIRQIRLEIPALSNRISAIDEDMLGGRESGQERRRCACGGSDALDAAVKCGRWRR